jgi:hypothetical protein
MSGSESEEIGVGHLSGIQESVGVNESRIDQRYIIRPEFAPRDRYEAGHQRGHRGRCSRRIRVTGMSDDPEHPIFCQWAGSPRLFTGFREPLVRSIVLNVRRIHQGNQNVDVEQKAGHGSSSSS